MRRRSSSAAAWMRPREAAISASEAATSPLSRSFSRAIRTRVTTVPSRRGWPSSEESCTTSAATRSPISTSVTCRPGPGSGTIPGAG